MIEPHHVFVLADGWYLDGNGVLDRAGFEAAWARDGAVDFAIAHIAPYDADAMGPTIIRRDQVMSAVIAAALRAGSGPG